MRFPTLLCDVLPDASAAQVRFPFKSWAIANHFDYPEPAGEFLAQCGSAAEAFFVRPFISRADVVFLPFPRNTIAASSGGYVVEMQVPCARHVVDVQVSTADMSLAIEIDGMAFHHRSRDQVAADYLRERRLVLKGHTVIRFTAQEVMSNARECWRQVEAIFDRRSR